MKKVDTSVDVLVRMIKEGELRLPEMQRRYVWRAPRVRDLLDSLYRAYPTGSILVWETTQKVPTHDAAVEQPANPYGSHKLLLDGQQRLTSLTAVINGEPVTVRGRKRPIEILFNLDHPDGPPSDLLEVEGDEDSPVQDEDDPEPDEEEEDEQDRTLLQRINRRTFVVASRALLAQPNWISVSEVFRNTNDWQLLKSRVAGPDDPKFDLYSKRLQRLRGIRQYPYVMHVLEPNLDYVEVAEIFVRVNSLGAKLRGSDLALAQITSRWPNSLQLFERYQEQCEKSGFNIDPGMLIRTMVVFATRQCRFHTVSTTPIALLQAGWEQAKAGLNYAINYLKSNASIESETLLSSPFFFIPIAVYSVLRNGRISPEESRQLLHWLYVANARGHYSRGSSETVLDFDLRLLFSGATPAELLRPIVQQFGRLTIEPSDLAERGQRSPLFSMAYLALKARGAKDWYSGIGLSLTHQGKLHYIQYHHIFPKSLLQGKYEKGEINEIANMAFISSKSNLTISNKNPETYLTQLAQQKGRAALEAQCIPLDPNLHKIDNYLNFLEERRSLLADAINALIASSAAGGAA